VLDDNHNFCQNLSKNRRISGELDNVTLAELPSNLMRQTLVLICSLRVESLHTLFAVCGSTQWRIFRAFKVFSEHLKLKKKLKKKLFLGHSLAINDKNCLYLHRCLSQRIYFSTRPNDFYLYAQASLQVVR